MQRSEAVDQLIDECHHVMGARDEILDFASTGIDDFLPGFEFDLMQCQPIES